MMTSPSINDQNQPFLKLKIHNGQHPNTIPMHFNHPEILDTQSANTKPFNSILIKGSFGEAEDDLIIAFVNKYGDQDFRGIERVLPGRFPKQCRERWFNHLHPSITKDPWLNDEDRLIFELHQRHGRRWSLIARSLPGRSDNAVKNRFESSISKRIEIDETGTKILVPSKARRYQQRVQKRRPSKYALRREAVFRRQLPIPLLNQATPVHHSTPQVETHFLFDDFVQFWPDGETYDLDLETE
jgi:hypothetical protein